MISAPSTTSTRLWTIAVNASVNPDAAIGQPEQPPPRQPPEESRAEEHADREPDEDRPEHRAIRGVTAAEVEGVSLRKTDDHPGSRERAEHADDQTAHDLGLTDELPAFGDRADHRRL